MPSYLQNIVQRYNCNCNSKFVWCRPKIMKDMKNSVLFYMTSNVFKNSDITSVNEKKKVASDVHTCSHGNQHVSLLTVDRCQTYGRQTDLKLSLLKIVIDHFC